MTEKIEPAMSAEEWASLGPNGVGHPPMPSTLDDITWLDQGDLGKAIAIANATLRDSDRRKITRRQLQGLRIALRATDGVYARGGEEFLNALESYLPPE